MIKVGDYVNVYFEYTERIENALVTYTPVATGDCWHLQLGDGTVVYVQTFTKMEKLN